MVTVPEGTVVTDHDGELLADLCEPATGGWRPRGGQGGRGNARFLSNRRRAPTFAEQGEPGEERWLRLELKLMADVALVGFPNVGKSTLISRISAAKPKIADYPFTTLEPNLGVVRLDDGDEFVVADVPGLIEGASEGRGLGHQFLRHVERARVLAILVDLAETAPHAAGRAGADPARRAGPLPARPARPAAGRRRLPGRHRGDRPRMDRPTHVCGHRGGHLRRWSALWPTPSGPLASAEPEPEAFVVHRPIAEGVLIEREDDAAGEWSGARRSAP